MILLIIGLVLFFATHLSGLFGSTRAALRARLGDGLFYAIYSLLSIGGVVLMVLGYQMAEGDAHGLWSPPEWARSFAHSAMPIAVILVVGGAAPTNFRRFAAHPMALGILIWAAVHLVNNHAVEDLILFGAFAVYALLDLFVISAGKPLPERRPAIRDVLAVAGGLAAYGGTVYVHNQFVPIFN